MTVSNDEDFQGMVRQFNQAVDAKPDIKLRVKLIQEEAEEFIKAIKSENTIETIDALCDLAYVTYGAADVLNLQLDTKELSDIAVSSKSLDWAVLHSNLLLSDFNEMINDVVIGLCGTGTLKTAFPEMPELADFYDLRNISYLQLSLTDLIIGTWDYAAHGLAINLGPFFREVHRTNMHKLKGPKREDGKQLKPEGWKPPRIKALYNKIKGNAHVTCDLKSHKHITDDKLVRPHEEGGYFCIECEGLIVSAQIDDDIRKYYDGY